MFIENKWANIDVIYYEYGALVLVYNNSERATRSFNILQDAMFDSKPLLVLLLPNIQVLVTVLVLCQAVSRATGAHRTPLIFISRTTAITRGVSVYSPASIGAYTKGSELSEGLMGGHMRLLTRSLKLTN